MWKVAEVATRLRVCTKTVYRLIKRGELEASKTGRVLRIPETAVQTYLDTQSTSRPSAA